MKGRITSIVFAGAWLIASSSAWSWTMDKGKVRFSNVELGICRMFEHDAAVIILNRQEGYPLDFADDADSPPLNIQKQERANMISEAKAIPLEISPEKRRTVSEQFTKRVLSKCLRIFHDTQPEGKY